MGSVYDQRTGITTYYESTADGIRAMDAHLQQIREYESRTGASADPRNDAAKSQANEFFNGNGNLGRLGDPSKWPGPGLF